MRSDRSWLDYAMESVDTGLTICVGVVAIAPLITSLLVVFAVFLSLAVMQSVFWPDQDHDRENDESYQA